jgi:pSer/pThr/pTyr-binding forkhead associated (FHA) protein
MSDWKLLIEDDVGDTISVPLLRGAITIGRKEGNTVRLTARNVSRFHARLVTEDEQLFIEDLESYNGVKLNGDRIKGRVAVNEGDLIEIGDYHLALQLEVAQMAPGGTASAVSDLFPDNTDDAFAGETQRWEPSPSQLPTRDSGTTPTGLDGLDTDETARMPTAQGSAEMHTAEEAEGDVSDPLSPGLSSLRSLAALDGDDFKTPMVGSPLLNLGDAAVETEQLPVVDNTPAPIPPTTEPYFPAYVEASETPESALPSVDLKATATPVWVSLVDAPTPDLDNGLVFVSSSPSMPEFGEPPAAQVSAPSASSDASDAGDSPLPLSLGPSLASAAAASQATEAFSTPAERENAAPAKLEPVVESAPPVSAPPVAEASPPSNIETEATEAMPLAHGAEVDTSLPRLVALNTVLAGASFPIEGEDMVVGRVEGCDLLIQHKSVSRSHCRLVREGDAVRVIDLKSANGTLVNSVELD